MLNLVMSLISQMLNLVSHNQMLVSHSQMLNLFLNLSLVGQSQSDVDLGRIKSTLGQSDIKSTLTDEPSGKFTEPSAADLPPDKPPDKPPDINLMSYFDSIPNVADYSNFCADNNTYPNRTETGVASDIDIKDRVRVGHKIKIRRFIWWFIRRKVNSGGFSKVTRRFISKS